MLAHSFSKCRLYICTFAEVHLCNYACFMCECVSDSANSLSGSIRPAVGGAAAHLASTWWICWEWAEPLDTLQWLHRERRCGHTVSKKEVEKMMEVENRRQDRPMEERWEDVGGMRDHTIHATHNIWRQRIVSPVLSLKVFLSPKSWAAYIIWTWLL